MKPNSTFFLALIFAIGLTGCGGTSADVAEEMKQLIPAVKTLVEDNLDLFNSVQDTLSTKGSSFMDSEGIATITGTETSISETDLFTSEEKEAIKTLFALSEQEIKILGYNAGQYTLAWDNLVDLRLKCIAGEGQVELWKDRAYYFEEVAENWYAYIIVSQPI